MDVANLIFAAIGAVVGVVGTLATWLATRRHPRIRAGQFGEDTDVGYYEGYEVEVVVGRRPLEVTQIGLLVLYGPRLRRRKLHLRGRPYPPLPTHLSDGQTVTTAFELDGLIEEILARIGDEERMRSKVRGYVRASGHEYTKRVSRGALMDRTRAKARKLRSEVASWRERG
jgi:hypothetical protein